jgi:DnaD/phage-associated family protein
MGRKMDFTLETTDMDLGDTPIENIFLNDFMPMANGTYVKVYLLGYKYAHDRDLNIEVNNKTIAKHLDIPLEDVLRAWDFWESKGIIKKEGEGVNHKVTFLNLKQLYIKNNFKKNKEEKEENVLEKEVIEANQIPSINNMFTNIDYLMHRGLQPTEKMEIIRWIKEYNMNPDVIEKAFNYSCEIKGKRSIKYVEGIIRNWYDLGLTNIDSVIDYFKNEDEKYYRYQKVMKALGLSHKGVNVGDFKLVNKWFDEYGYSLEVVLKGCEKASNVMYPTVKYIDGVITDWHKKGFKTVEDIDQFDKKEVKEKVKVNSANKNKKTPNRFHNFEQRSNNYTKEELEEIFKKKRENYQKNTKGDVNG